MALDDHQLPPGYMGKILEIDLTNEKYETRPLNPKLARLFFGGRGLGIALLCQHFLQLQENKKYINAPMSFPQHRAFIGFGHRVRSCIIPVSLGFDNDPFTAVILQFHAEQFLGNT